MGLGFFGAFGSDWLSAGVSVGVSAGVSIAEGGIKIGDLSAPQLSKGKYAQTEFGIKGEAGLSASIGVGKYKSEDGTSMLGVKAGPFSGGISVGKYTIPVRTFNDILRNRLQWDNQ